MACDLCDSCENGTEHTEPTEGRYCGHEERCDCDIPKEPLPPKCHSDDGGTDCDPDARVRELEQVVETSNAEAAEATETLAELTKLRDDFKTAVEQFHGDAESRKNREAECCDFIRCKRPDVPDDLEECVEKQIKRICDYVHDLEKRAHYLNWARGNAEQQVGWRQWEYDRLAREYEQLKALSTQCHSQCEQARTKYDEACAADDEKLKFLYWKIAEQLSERSKDCCDDYEGKLCEIFEALVEASKHLSEAKRTAKGLSAQLETVKKQLEQYGKSEFLWGKIAKLVSTCCDCPTDSDTKQHETPNKQTS